MLSSPYKREIQSSQILTRKGTAYKHSISEYGMFASEGSKFFSLLPELNSRMRRRLAEMLKLKKRVKYSEKFTFKAAGLPSFRVQALSDKDVDKLVRIGSNEKKLSELKKIFNSPSFHIQTNSLYSCKDEVVALNLLSLPVCEMSCLVNLRGCPRMKKFLLKIFLKGNAQLSSLGLSLKG